MALRPRPGALIAIADFLSSSPGLLQTAAKRKAEAEIDEAEAMTHLMLPRKKKELYKAMQMGIAKKNEKVGKLAEKRQKISEGTIKVVK